MLLKHKKLYHHCIEPTFPIIEDDSRPSAAENKIIDANAETCNLIAGTLDSATFTEIFDDNETMENANLLWSKLTKRFASSTFNNQARIWMRFCRITYNGNLRSFILEIRQCLNEVISVKVEVGTPTLAFNILTKLPEEYHNVVEKVTTNTETLGNPNAILNLLHDVALKEEALQNQNNHTLALNREMFRSKTIHYCKDGRHNPLASHPAERCWQLHPEMRPEKYNKDARINLTIARALMTRVHTRAKRDHELTVVLDTGASDHMFNDKRFFSNLTYVTNMPISTGWDKSTLSATARGTAEILDRNGTIWSLVNCLYVPGLTTNLISLSQLAEEIKIKKCGINSEVYLNKETKPAFVCNVGSGILEAKIAMAREAKCLNTVNLNWHARLGHMHEQGIRKFLPTFKEDNICNICAMCKFPKLPFQHSFQESTSLLENIHMDLCGPISTPSLAGARYFMLLVDQFSGYISIKFLKQKRGEFKNNSFRNFIRTEGIKHVLSPPYTPQHNGIAERANRSVIEKTRCLLLQSKLPTKYWAEAAATATMLCNMVRKGNKTPYEVWHKLAPPINNLRPFGCKTWVRIPESARTGKFDAVSWEGIMLGYASQASAYRVLRIADKSIVIILQKKTSFMTLWKNYLRRAHTTTNEVPKNFKDSRQGKDAHKWQAVIKKELENMVRLNVWEIVDKKPTDHPISTTWVFKIKRDHNHSVTEHKARLCAQGFHQIEGLDYLKMFSPTRKISSLQLLISHAARYNYSFHQMDVKSAFLNAPLEEKLTLTIPDGINEDKEKKVLRLHKAIY
ncbi:hypothetical protein O181_082797 [Austropuccinia psidii MF-1]|uniref:Integrase catalytic domain-containing protein n=1 Tax=Austropuccinia psidii MF-1 TaxID=1389203 RepID=A0A9Q3FR63_9BASI|nr:hypothetical protein [Austropuccinia psidii MF-1]